MESYLTFKKDLRMLRRDFPDLVIKPGLSCHHLTTTYCDLYVSDPAQPYHRELDRLDRRTIRVGNPLIGDYQPGELAAAAGKLLIFRRAQRGGF